MQDVVRNLRLAPAQGTVGDTGYPAEQTHSRSTEPGEPLQRGPGPDAPIPPGQSGRPFPAAAPPAERMTTGHAPAHTPVRGPDAGPDALPEHQPGSGGNPTPPDTDSPGPQANRPTPLSDPGQESPGSGQPPAPQTLLVVEEDSPVNQGLQALRREGIEPASDWVYAPLPNPAQDVSSLLSQQSATGVACPAGELQDHPLTPPPALDLQLSFAGQDGTRHTPPVQAATIEPEPTTESTIPQDKSAMAVFGILGTGTLGLPVGAPRWARRAWALLGSLLSSIPLLKRARALPVRCTDMARCPSPTPVGQGPGTGVQPEAGERIELLFDSTKAP